MLNALMPFLHRFLRKTEPDNKVTATPSCDSDSPREARETPACTESRQQDNIEQERFEIEQMRRRVTGELHLSDVTARQRERIMIDKWFNRGDQMNSGSHAIVELERRMEESSSGDEEIVHGLPVQEDMFLAFSKPEIDLFEEEKISLSGVFMRFDPHEELDDNYCMPRFVTSDRAVKDLERTAQIPMYSETSITNLEKTAQFTAYSEESIEDQENTAQLSAYSEESVTDQENTAQLSAYSEVSTTDQENTGDLPVYSENFNLDFSVDPSDCVTPDLASLIENSSCDEAKPDDFCNVPDLVSQGIPDQISDFSPSTPKEIRMIDPSALFEEWTGNIVDPDSSSTSDAIQSTAPIKQKRGVKPATKPKDEYWQQSDRLTRFGRRRTSASCSSSIRA